MKTQADHRQQMGGENTQGCYVYLALISWNEILVSILYILLYLMLEESLRDSLCDLWIVPQR